MVAEEISSRIAGLKLDQIHPSTRPPRKSASREDHSPHTGTAVANGIDHFHENPLTQRFYYVMQQKHQSEGSPSSSSSPLATAPATKRRPPVPAKSMIVVAPALPPRPTTSTVANVPPPIPPRIPSHSCLWCRDFSAVDAHAASFPREDIKSLNTLARALTDPFPSETDKARAIFTWLHHNIAYNTEAFFNGTVKATTPEDTLRSGLAVCEGYAALFVDLARKSGIIAKVISGFGKGYGYVRPEGSNMPTFESNHAWNVVKLESGEWHLIDPCWGAGHIGPGSTAYIKKFNPFFFCSSVEEFGQSHFPSKADQQFLALPRSWAEFIGIPENPIMSRHVAGLYLPIRQVTPSVKSIASGRTEFFLQLACPKVAVDCPLVLMGPGGKVTEMVQEVDGWRCSADVQMGRWMCGIPTEFNDENCIIPSLKDYRSQYSVRGICVWECDGS